MEIPQQRAQQLGGAQGRTAKARERVEPPPTRALRVAVPQPKLVALPVPAGG